MSAFAVFCADDGSLIFYNRGTVPAAGSEFEGKVASNVYTGFESGSYSQDSSVPWYNERASILSVSFTPEFTTVKPISTAYWFALENIASFDSTNLDTSNTTLMYYMFSGCKSLTTLNLSNFNTSNVTRMDSMFADCSNLTSLDVSSFDTSKVTSMNSIFSGCKSLTSLNISNFNTSNLTSTYMMFYACSSLTSLDLSNFDTSNVTSMNYMIYGCYKLTSIDISNFNTSNVTNMSYMFMDCEALEILDLSSFDTFLVINMSNMFNRCFKLNKIYVSNMWSIEYVTSHSNMFANCNALVGAISYDSSKTNATYANYITGYLTYKFYFPYSENRFVVEGSDLNRIANALRNKVGTSEGLSFPEGFVEAISGISGGGGGGGGSTAPASLKDVNFYDYDGTLVASYTLTEAQALTALPNGPTHEGLTFLGWNWTLDKIKALTRPMNVGAMYITDDGKTRLHIRIAAEGRMSVPLYISQTVANGVSIDWGDGSAPETLAGTGNVNTTHTYAAVGDFTISLTVADGCELGLGYNYSSYCIMGSTGNNGRVYCNMLQSVYVGKNVTSIRAYAFYLCSSLASIIIPDSVTSIGTYAFAFCYSLASIIIPDGVASIEDSIFDNCRSLASITIPDGATSIRDSAFFNCLSLASITIPDNMTSIGPHAFSGCYSLASITIPDGMTSIEDSAFYNCYGMAEYHLKPVTSPTLSSTNAFTNISSDCIIYVPAGSLNAYQTATNWSTYASYMREETI